MNLQKTTTPVQKVLALVLAVALVIGGGLYLRGHKAVGPVNPVQEANLGSGGSFETATTFLIGNAVSGTTLTSSYNAVSSTATVISSQPNVAFFVGYKPQAYGSQLFLLLERSPDMGVTWYGYDVIQPTATATLVYVAGASSTAGIPFAIPGNGILTSGVTTTASFDITLGAGLFRISAKESTTSTKGILYLSSFSASN